MPLVLLIPLFPKRSVFPYSLRPAGRLPLRVTISHGLWGVYVHSPIVAFPFRGCGVSSYLRGSLES